MIELFGCGLLDECNNVRGHVGFLLPGPNLRGLFRNTEDRGKTRAIYWSCLKRVLYGILGNEIFLFGTCTGLSRCF